MLSPHPFPPLAGEGTALLAQHQKNSLPPQREAGGGDIDFVGSAALEPTYRWMIVVGRFKEQSDGTDRLICQNKF